MSLSQPTSVEQPRGKLHRNLFYARHFPSHLNEDLQEEQDHFYRELMSILQHSNFLSEWNTFGANLRSLLHKLYDLYTLSAQQRECILSILIETFFASEDVRTEYLMSLMHIINEYFDAWKHPTLILDFRAIYNYIQRNFLTNDC